MEPVIEKPLMSSSHGLELNNSMNSRVLLVFCPGTALGLYMISVITRPVLRLDGPGGSRSVVYPNCPNAALAQNRMANSRGETGNALRRMTGCILRMFIEGRATRLPMAHKVTFWLRLICAPKPVSIPKVDALDSEVTMWERKPPRLHGASILFGTVLNSTFAASKQVTVS